MTLRVENYYSAAASASMAPMPPPARLRVGFARAREVDSFYVPYVFFLPNVYVGILYYYYISGVYKYVQCNNNIFWSAGKLSRDKS